MFGRYIDSQQRSTFVPSNPLYRYDIREQSWTLLFKNTQDSGGPNLIFDHQMCYDTEKDTLYLFGGP